MKPTWILVVLTMTTMSFAQNPKTDCTDKGGLAQMGPKGEYWGCTWEQNAPGGHSIIPKDCKKVVDKDGVTVLTCGKVADNPPQSEPDQHESQAKPQSQI